MSEMQISLQESESALIRLVVGGYSNHEISRFLRTTEHVVKNRVKAIYDKLGLSSRIELVIWNHERLDHAAIASSANG